MRPAPATLALLGLLALSACHRAEVSDDPAADPNTQRAVDQAADVADKVDEVKGMSPDDPMANGTTGDVSIATSLPSDRADRPARVQRRPSSMIDTRLVDPSTPKPDGPQ